MLLAALVWSSIVVLAIGVVLNQMWLNATWGRTSESAILGVAAFVLAGIGGRLTHIRTAHWLVLVWVLALCGMVGPAPVLGMALLLAGALGIGGLIVPPRFNAPIALTIIVGLALPIGLIGWLLPFPLHYRWVYALLLGATIAWRRRSVRVQLSDATKHWCAVVNDAPHAATFAVLLIGIASSGCWMPTLQFDDLAFHIGMPMQLMTLHYYRMDFFSQMWALAPWGGDIVQAIAQVLANGEARGVVDAFWLLACTTLTFRFGATLGMPVWLRWIAGAMFASLPMTFSLVGGMQAELPATAVLLALVIAVAEAPATPDRRAFIVISILAGLMLALKTGFLGATVPIGIWLLWRWRGRLPFPALTPALGMVFFIMASSLVYAYVLSGNPLLPLMNGVFHSPYVPPGNLGGTPYKAGGGFSMPWQITFHSARFVEGWDGAAGVTLLGLLGAFLTAFFQPRLRAPACVALVAFLIPFEAINYYRYAFPALALITPIAIAALADVLAQRQAILLLGTLASLNLLFQGSTYYTSYDATFLTHRKHHQRRLYEQRIPERIFARYIREHSDTDSVLFCDIGRPFFSEMNGRGFTVSYYDTELTAAYWDAESDPEGLHWRAFFARTGVRYAVTTAKIRSQALTRALDGAEKVLQFGEQELWRLPNATTTTLVAQRDVAATRLRP